MGAPQSRLYETLLALQKRGWQVLVITAMPNYPKGKVFEGYRGKWSMKDEINGIELKRYTLYASHSKKAIPRIISMLSFSFTALFSTRAVRKFNPDYVITESPPLTVGLTGLWLAKRSGAKHILNVSDIWPLSALRLGAISEGYMYKQLEKLERYLYKQSYACMGQSFEITDRLNEAGSKKTLLFRNGVDTERFEGNRITNKEREGKLKIVYAGLLGIAQGVADLCKHVSFASANAELHIYGDGSQKQELLEYLTQNPDCNIYLHSAVGRAEIPRIIAQYDVTLIPLVTPIYGAVPSKIYEAMAAGLPIIFSGGGEGERIIKEHNTGWVCVPSDHQQIQDTILKVSEMDAQSLNEIRTHCIKAADEVFNRAIQIDTLDKFLTREE